ncbi:MAG: exodeoxyribonuclease III [Thermodesulfobacteriota bacterium]
MPINIEWFLSTLTAEVASYQVPVVDLIAVQTRDPFKVLVATILSARTRDETTAKAAERLFAQAPDVTGLAALSQGEIEKLIKPVGFFRNKAGFLKKLPAALAEHDDQEVPDTMAGLLALPGVGRKTANLVLAVAFKKDAICVDTHVHRIMNIWGYVATKSPEQTEMALRKKLPKKYWQTVNSILVAFGQGTCKPVGPQCDRCVLASECPKLGVTPRRLPGGKGKKIISWNVNGIRALEKKGFADIMAGLGPDIMAIQETKAQEAQLSEALTKMAGYHCYFHSAQRKGYSGVAIYSRKKPLAVTEGLGISEFDDEGRVLTCEYETFFLINCYFPNAQSELKRLDYKLAFDRAVQEQAVRLRQSGKMVLICGDLNVAHKEIDLANPKQNEKNPGFSPQERQGMDELLAAGFSDTFRIFNQEPDQYSWWSYRFNARAKNIGWRIDYFLVDEASKERVKKAEILSEIMGSDHCPVTVEIGP